MSKFLLDATLSPRAAIYLQKSLGLEVVHQGDVLPGAPTDDEIAAFASRSNRVIVTFDTDFGEIYHLRQGRAIGSSSFSYAIRPSRASTPS
jgi:predicted nuclease of predicted toxin-antitoxin system